MIVECIIGGVTLVTCASLALANAIDKRETAPDALDRVTTQRQRGFAQQREVLERRRAEYVKQGASFLPLSIGYKENAEGVLRIDMRLLELAKEEANQEDD